MPISSDMGGLLPTLILSLIAVFVLAAESASARPKKHPFKNSVAPTMQYQHGTPVIMQGMKWSKGSARHAVQSLVSAECGLGEQPHYS
jgi:hypothetical protein